MTSEETLQSDLDTNNVISHPLRLERLQAKKKRLERRMELQKRSVISKINEIISLGNSLRSPNNIRIVDQLIDDLKMIRSELKAIDPFDFPNEDSLTRASEKFWLICTAFTLLGCCNGLGSSDAVDHAQNLSKHKQGSAPTE